MVRRTRCIGKALHAALQRETAELIDKEVRTLVEDAIKRAMKIPKKRRQAPSSRQRLLARAADASEIDLILLVSRRRR
jgi:ATP-dependent Zn protease